MKIQVYDVHLREQSGRILSTALMEAIPVNEAATASGEVVNHGAMIDKLLDSLRAHMPHLWNDGRYVTIEFSHEADTIGDYPGRSKTNLDHIEVTNAVRMTGDKAEEESVPWA